MENKETPDALAAFCKRNMYLYPTFSSREAMKAYYLQMNEFVNCGLTAPQGNKEGLRRLKRKLKQYVSALRHLNSHEWGDSIADLQTACGGFLMLKNEEFGKKKEVNKSIGKHFEFIVRISQSAYLLQQLQGVLEIHCMNLEQLLKEEEGFM